MGEKYTYKPLRLGGGLLPVNCTTTKTVYFIYLFFFWGGGLPITEYKKCEAKLAAVLQEKKLKNVDFFYKPTLLRGFCTM